MKIGDIVKVNNPKLKTHGMKGNVTYVYHTDLGYRCDVLLETDRSITINSINLKKVEPTVRYDAPTCVKHLAYIYVHNDDNPCDLEEAYNDYGLECPNALVYGTRQEIIDAMKAELSDWENCFAIIDGKLVLAETNVELKGF